MIRIRGELFCILLARADVSQAGFSRLTGVSARQVNNWCRDRAAVPDWATLLVVVLQQQSPESLMNTAGEELRRR
jgi:DNA-binding transcriptional regulator YiaG